MKIKKILILTSSLEIIERRNSSKITISLIYVAKLKLKMKIFDELTIVFHVSFQKRYCKQKKKKYFINQRGFFPKISRSLFQNALFLEVFEFFENGIIKRDYHSTIFQNVVTKFWDFSLGFFLRKERDKI